MILINILLSALVFAMIGGRFNTRDRKIHRAYPVIIMAGLLFVNHPDFTFPIWLVIFGIVRLLPTGGLLTAANGEPPIADGSKVEFALYDITMRIWKRLPVCCTNWHVWGVIYGFIRAILAIPFLVLVGNYWFLAFLAQGAIYWACTKQKKYAAVSLAEVITGIIFALCLT